MREIKFRGKRLDNGAWIAGYYLEQEFCDGKGRGAYIKIDGCSPVQVDPATVGQFTGLFDKTGKGICEGDVFTVLDKYPKVVRFITDRACFCVANTDDVNEKYIDPWHAPSSIWWGEFGRSIKIIGNEHDNPELLKNRIK